MYGFRSFVAASFFFLAGAGSALAQEPTAPQYEALMRWVVTQQEIIQETMSPLQHMPAPRFESDAARMGWVSEARSWLNGYRATLQTSRLRADQLGPVPEAGAVTALYANQQRALPELFDGLENFLGQYDRGVTAAEHNEPDAFNIASVNVIDAALLIQIQFRNLNALQAEATDGPQRYLLRSFASSYDAMIAALRAKRASFFGENVNASTVAAIRAATAAMREHIRAGRLSAQAAEAALPARTTPEQSDFLRRIRLAYQSFGGSFDREDELADLFDSMARLLDTGARYPDAEPELDALVSRIGQLDLERLVDIQRRTQLVQRIMPPT
jgi:hypothetical protein